MSIEQPRQAISGAEFDAAIDTAREIAAGLVDAVEDVATTETYTGQQVNLAGGLVSISTALSNIGDTLGDGERTLLKVADALDGIAEAGRAIAQAGCLIAEAIERLKS